MKQQDIETIEDIARFHRSRYLSNQDRPMAEKLRQIASAQGIATIGIRLNKSPEFRAVAIELSNGSQYIIYNKAQPEEVQQHYIGHEIFHLVAEHPSGIDPEREAAADLYADTLLGLLSFEKDSP